MIYTVPSQNISGDDSQMRILFTGSDLATLDQVAQEARTNLSKIENLSIDRKVDLTNCSPKYKVTFDDASLFSLTKTITVNLYRIMNPVNLYLIPS